MKKADEESDGESDGEADDDGEADGDGDNDALTFEGLESFPENTITIYNRWGYPVFEQKGYQLGGELWNGENGGDILPADTYYYVLNFNGETYKSPITIMR